jgi:hypothetical protein
MSPGGTHWNSGSFQQSYIRNIYRMQLNETRFVALNEYGSILLRSKHHPLVVLEAKAAMTKGGNTGGEGYTLASKVLKTIVEEEEMSRETKENT